MNEMQADTIARAILDPNSTREEIQRKRAAEALRIARRRKVAWFVLFGCAFGAATSYFMGGRISRGTLVGGLVGYVVGSIVVAWLSTKSVAT